MLDEKEIEEIKRRLILQIEREFPEDKKELAKESIKKMSEEELEEFLKENSKTEERQSIPCIFCNIISEKNPCYKIGENKKSIAILEINPISKAHTLIIPKEHFSGEEKMPNDAHTLAKKISKRIKTKLKPKKIKIFFSEVMGHQIINILPIYSQETESSPRNKAEKEELESLKEILEEKAKVKKIRTEKTKKIQSPNGKIWLPRRIP